MPSIPTVPSLLGSGGAYLAKGDGAGKPGLPDILGDLASAAPGGRVYSNATRPAANTFTAGMQIWNTDDNAPNFSDGTNWRDAAGLVT
jgi:hypothetical protein